LHFASSSPLSALNSLSTLQLYSAQYLLPKVSIPFLRAAPCAAQQVMGPVTGDVHVVASAATPLYTANTPLAHLATEHYAPKTYISTVPAVRVKRVDCIGIISTPRNDVAGVVYPYTR
jgi:hypothetical protein